MIEYTVKVFNNGSKEWFLNDQVHREDGPAMESDDGTKYWYTNGLINRKDGPAIEYANGNKAWYINGNCHREDGPAIEYSDGTKSWYINGVNYTEEQFNKKINPKDCSGSTVTVDGIDYILQLKN
jgi:hypothetical protein